MWNEVRSDHKGGGMMKMNNMRCMYQHCTQNYVELSGQMSKISVQMSKHSNIRGCISRQLICPLGVRTLGMK